MSWEADAGRFENEWLKLSERFENIALHEYVIMPNHFHAILETVGATLAVAQNLVVAQTRENIFQIKPYPFIETQPRHARRQQHFINYS